LLDSTSAASWIASKSVTTKPEFSTFPCRSSSF
jgi:hypothetical protein